MDKAREFILNQQQSWANKRGISFSKKGYVRNLEDNLYEPPKEDSLDEFIRGRGGELESKMLALHSSSALVVNFFHYWRYRDTSKLAVAIGLSSQSTSLRFEITYPKPAGIRGVRPHVDIEFTGTHRPTAVESKFTETYSKARKSLRKAYVETPGIWGRLALCESMAKVIANGEKVFEYLDAPQLLKHILGLKTKYGEGNFTFLYLWYDFTSDESDKHRRELKTFENGIGNDVDFRHLTYQDLFETVSLIPSGDNGWVSYMRNRYFTIPTET